MFGMLCLVNWYGMFGKKLAVKAVKIKNNNHFKNLILHFNV